MASSIGRKRATRCARATPRPRDHRCVDQTPPRDKEFKRNANLQEVALERLTVKPPPSDQERGGEENPESG